MSPLRKDETGRSVLKHNTHPHFFIIYVMEKLLKSWVDVLINIHDQQYISDDC